MSKPKSSKLRGEWKFGQEPTLVPDTAPQAPAAKTQRKIYCYGSKEITATLEDRIDQLQQQFRIPEQELADLEARAESAEQRCERLLAERKEVTDLLHSVHNWFMQQAPEHYNGCGLWLDVDAFLKSRPRQVRDSAS
jgi:MoxR-like ATPase